jgi:hypothetical protein
VETGKSQGANVAAVKPFAATNIKEQSPTPPLRAQHRRFKAAWPPTGIVMLASRALSSIAEASLHSLAKASLRQRILRLKPKRSTERAQVAHISILEIIAALSRRINSMCGIVRLS